MKTIDPKKKYMAAVSGMSDFRLQVETNAKLEQLKDLNKQAELNKTFGKSSRSVEKDSDEALEQLKICNAELRRRLGNKSIENRMLKRGVR